MAYTFGKKEKLFAIKDPDNETKEVVLVNRGALIGVGVTLGVIVIAVVTFFSHNSLIGSGAGLLVGGLAAWLPVHADKKREKYYSTLIETVQDRLEKLGHPLSRRQVMDLLYIRDVRSTDEHVIVADTVNKELVISLCHNKKKQRERPERKEFFETRVVGEPEPAEETTDTVQTAETGEETTEEAVEETPEPADAVDETDEDGEPSGSEEAPEESPAVEPENAHEEASEESPAASPEESPEEVQEDAPEENVVSEPETSNNR